MSSFGKNLTRFRKEMGMTQEQLAQAVNVTRQAVSGWENGRTEPDLGMLTALASALNVTAEELIFGRKNGEYRKFQRKYLVCAGVSLLFVILTVLLQTVVGPRLKLQVNSTYKGMREYFLFFRLVIPTVQYASLGVLVASLIALFSRIALEGWWKRGALLLGLAAVLPALLFILDTVLLFWTPEHSGPLVRYLLISSVPDALILIILPMLSGVLLFLGIHRDTRKTT